MAFTLYFFEAQADVETENNNTLVSGLELDFHSPLLSPTRGDVT